MSWVKMNMRFPGTCVECGKPVKAGEVGLWSKGLGVKHLSCVDTGGISCVICGKPAGCQTCEMFTNCDIQRVSQLCVCSNCSRVGLPEYVKRVGKKFPMLAVKD